MGGIGGIGGIGAIGGIGGIGGCGGAGHARDAHAARAPAGALLVVPVPLPVEVILQRRGHQQAIGRLRGLGQRHGHGRGLQLARAADGRRHQPARDQHREHQPAAPGGAPRGPGRRLRQQPLHPIDHIAVQRRAGHGRHRHRLLPPQLPVGHDGDGPGQVDRALGQLHRPFVAGQLGRGRQLAAGKAGQRLEEQQRLDHRPGRQPGVVPAFQVGQLVRQHRRQGRARKVVQRPRGQANLLSPKRHRAARQRRDRQPDRERQAGRRGQFAQPLPGGPCVDRPPPAQPPPEPEVPHAQDRQPAARGRDYRRQQQHTQIQRRGRRRRSFGQQRNGPRWGLRHGGQRRLGIQVHHHGRRRPGIDPSRFRGRRGPGQGQLQRRRPPAVGHRQRQRRSQQRAHQRRPPDPAARRRGQPQPGMAGRPGHQEPQGAVDQIGEQQRQHEHRLGKQGQTDHFVFPFCRCSCSF